MASQVWKVYDTEGGRVVSVLNCVAPCVMLAGLELTSGQAAATCTATTGLFPGMLLVGKGITAGTTVLSVDSTTAFTLSANATAAVSGGQVLARSYIPYKADGTVATAAINLENYRDIFSAKTPMKLLNGSGSSMGDLSTPGVSLSVQSPTFVSPTGGAPGSVTVTGTAVAAISDDVAHEPPRSQTQTCSYVNFILDDGQFCPVLRRTGYDIVRYS